MNDSTLTNLSRRSAMAGLGASGIGLALATSLRQSSAQTPISDLSGHPFTGTWMTLANPALPDMPQVPHIAIASADGAFIAVTPVSDIGPNGPVLQTPLVGIWEAYDDRRAHFVASQTLSSFDGVVVGMVTVDGYPLVSEDGMSFADDGELVTVTIRDANGVVVDSFPGAGGRPVRGNRLEIGNATFPEVLPAATPTT